MPAAPDPPRPTRSFGPAPDEATLTGLALRGILPAGLTGRYLCIGAHDLVPPGVEEGPGVPNGMVHAIELRTDRAPRYRNRWITTDQVARLLGTNPVPGPPAVGADTVATNVVSFAGRTLALGAGSLAYELDGELGTVGRVDLAGHGRGIGPHPRVDPHTGALHLVSYGAEPAHHVLAPTSHTRITIPVPDAPGALQDILLTRERLVLLGEGFVGLADRSGQASTQWVDADLPNAIAAHDAPNLVGAHDLDAAVAVLTDGNHLARWTVAGGGAHREVLDGAPQRFGTTNPDVASAPAVLWTVADGEGTKAYRHDLRTGARSAHDFGHDRHPGPFAFVTDPARRDTEDGGWLVGFLHDEHRNETDLVILDAAALDRPPLATVRIPRRIPYGSGGTWVPATGAEWPRPTPWRMSTVTQSSPSQPLGSGSGGTTC